MRLLTVLAVLASASRAFAQTKTSVEPVTELRLQSLGGQQGPGISLTAPASPLSLSAPLSGVSLTPAPAVRPSAVAAPAAAAAGLLATPASVVSPMIRQLPSGLADNPASSELPPKALTQLSGLGDAVAGPAGSLAGDFQKTEARVFDNATSAVAQPIEDSVSAVSQVSGLTSRYLRKAKPERAAAPGAVDSPAKLQDSEWSSRPYTEFKAAAAVLAFAAIAYVVSPIVALVATGVAGGIGLALWIAVPGIAPLQSRPPPEQASVMEAAPAAAHDPATALIAEHLAEQGLPPALVGTREIAQVLGRLDQKPTPAQVRSAFARFNAEYGIMNRTEFFRDPAVWRQLRSRLETAVRRQLARGRRSLVLKSLGSSEGQEAYSLALLADDVLRGLGEDPRAWEINVEAYDFNPANLILASLGLYRDVPKAWLSDFERLPGGWYRARADLRRRIVPIRLDLSDRSQWQYLDRRPGQVLLYRYVHPYFPRDFQAQIVARLREGGWADQDGGILAYTVWGKGVLMDESTQHLVQIAPAGRATR